MTPEEALEAEIDQMVARLMENWDAVQILVSTNEAGTTRHAFKGRGNVYTRLGMCQEIIQGNLAENVAVELTLQEAAADAAISDMLAEELGDPDLPDDDDDGEAWKNAA